MSAFTGPASSGKTQHREGDPPDVLPPEARKAAMSTLDPAETKWTLAALVLATLAGIAIPLYFIAENKVTKNGKNSIAVAPDAKLLGGVILILCAIGFAALWKKKRTLVAFSLFLVGFAFTLFVGLIGFGFILLGGFLMLRAWRINKYGTTDSRVIRREVAAQPRGASARRRRKPGRRPRRLPPRGGHRPPASATRRRQPLARRSPSRPNRAYGLQLVQAGRSMRSAERSSRRASVRRRTNERAVGSSPSARSTSTSVTIPITVE